MAVSLLCLKALIKNWLKMRLEALGESRFYHLHRLGLVDSRLKPASQFLRINLLLELNIKPLLEDKLQPWLMGLVSLA